MSSKNELLDEYVDLILPHLDAAKKAYGLRGQNTAAHKASDTYTHLLKEYYENGGSLVALSKKLGVAYSGLRRRVFSSNIPPSPRKRKSAATEDTIKEAIERVKTARNVSTDEYHRVLFDVYHEGVSLAVIAKGLSLSSSAPLYYGIQRHEIRMQKGRVD